jgi:hypothetical protein
VRRPSRRPLRYPSFQVPFDPTHLADCRLWLDSIDTNYLYQETTAPGTTLANHNNDPVGTIRDRSKNAHHFSALTNANRALVAVSAGKGRLIFDGTDDFYTGPIISNANGACTMAVSWRFRTTPAATGGSVFVIKTSSTTWTEFVITNAAGFGYQEINWSCDTLSTAYTAAVGCGGGLNTTAHRAVITYDGTDNWDPSKYTLLLDGSSQTIVASGAFIRQATDVTSAGGRWDGTTLTNSRELNLDCVAIWSGVKTAQQIAKIDAWLLEHQ